MCFCTPGVRTPYCSSFICQTELKRIGGYGIESEVKKIIGQKDKKYQAFRIQKYYDTKKDMLRLMAELAQSTEQTITLTVEKDGEVGLSWEDNYIILHK